MNILLVNDTSQANLNWGCMGTSNALQNRIKENGWNYRSIFLSNTNYLYRLKKKSSYTHTKWINNSLAFLESGKKVAKFFSSFKKLLKKCVVKSVPQISSEFEIIYDNWLKYKNSIFKDEFNKIKWSDVVLINGEGSIYGRQIKGFYLMFLTWIVKEKFNKPVYLTNFTAQFDEHRSFTIGMARRTFKYYNQLICREPITKRRIKDLNLYKKEIKVYPDIILSHNVPMNSKKNFNFNLNDPFMIIGDSSHVTNDLIFQDKFFKELVIKFVKKIKKRFPSHQIVLSCCPDGLPGFEYLDLPKISSRHYNYRDYMYLCSKADLHISGRHHSTLLAINSSCPFISFSANTYKIKGDIELINWPFPYYDLTNLSENMADILKDSEILIEHNSKYKNLLSEKLDSLKRLSLNHVDVLKELE